MGWFSNIWKSVVGVASTIISAFVPPLAPAMWALNMAISTYTAIQTGNILGFVGGLAGGAIFGAMGRDLAYSISGTMGSFARTFAGGAILGGIEFGMSGFGAGLGSALGSGSSFGDAIKVGGFGAATGAIMGAAIEGSYMAGWQKGLHGLSYGDTLESQGIQREVGLYRGYSDITPVGKRWHKGIEIQDNYREYAGRWEFDTLGGDVFTKADAATGKFVWGTWKARSQAFNSLKLVTNSLDSVRAAYKDVTSQLGVIKFYHIVGFPSNCRTEAERLIQRAVSGQGR